MINGLCRITLPLVLIICSSSIARPQSCTPASSGLVSWWAGDTTENDIISGNNPSAVNAVTLMPAEVKDGFTFGTEGYIEIPGATIWRITTSHGRHGSIPPAPALTMTPLAAL